MNWTVIVVIVLLLGYVISETMGPSLKEGFMNPKRTDIGFATQESGGYIRDLRYTEAFVDIQGIGTATDFCRAVRRTNNPESLRISCALGHRDGMDTMEYNSRTKGEGVRFSRDDYWRTSALSGRMDYCRILKDKDTGEWYSGCLVAGRHQFKIKEERDSDPPVSIQRLLNAYDGIVVWFRWYDDTHDYAENAAFNIYGSPEFPSLLNAEISRGLQLNRMSATTRDYLRWGESGTLELNQSIPPRQIRAISCWVWWDSFEPNASIMDCHNSKFADRIILGIEGGGPALPPAERSRPVDEVRPEVVQAIGQLTEPIHDIRPPMEVSAAVYYFEIWDEKQRIMRLSAPMGSAKTNTWQHVVVTVTDGAAWWPKWQMWINGTLVAEKLDGRLSPAMEITENYIGKNMRGCIQDFRIYTRPVTIVELTKPRLHPTP